MCTACARCGLGILRAFRDVSCPIADLQGRKHRGGVGWQACAKLLQKESHCLRSCRVTFGVSLTNLKKLAIWPNLINTKKLSAIAHTESWLTAGYGQHTYHSAKLSVHSNRPGTDGEPLCSSVRVGAPHRSYPSPMLRKVTAATCRPALSCKLRFFMICAIDTPTPLPSSRI